MVQVEAATRWNHTGYFLKEGQAYKFVVPPGQTWRDWNIECGPEGYARWYLALFTSRLRVTRTLNGTARFFTLIGTIGELSEHAFIIGTGTVHVATADGELVCFANDVPWAYSNNRGAILLTVE